MHGWERMEPLFHIKEWKSFANGHQNLLFLLPFIFVLDLCPLHCYCVCSCEMTLCGFPFSRLDSDVWTRCRGTWGTGTKPARDSR